MSQTWVSATSFKRVVGGAIPAKHGAEWFERFWSHFWWVFVKGFHVGEFFVLTLLIQRALGDVGGLKRRLGVAAMVACTFAIFDEWHQHFIAYRGGRWTDVLIDWGGVAAASAVVGWMARQNADRTANGVLA